MTAQTELTESTPEHSAVIRFIPVTTAVTATTLPPSWKRLPEQAVWEALALS